MHDAKPGSRRQFLRRGLTGTLAALGALAMGQARAQTYQKMTQDQAGYKDSSTDQQCVSCSFFTEPDGCKIVQGPVGETGTCNYFSE